MRIVVIFLLVYGAALGQKKEVAITIDDVPNVLLNERYHHHSLLLERIDSLSIPVAIFINEHNIQKSAFQKENLEILTSWIKNKNITSGNHSFSHINYADTSFQAYQLEILKGETLTRSILESLGKKLEYFRFPYNSLGKDQQAHERIAQYLASRGYTIAPFTIESEDWMYNALYEDALKKNNHTLARQIWLEYVSFTLKLFEYFEQLSALRFGRNIKEIYLCHDNALNTDYLPQLVHKLAIRGYSFIEFHDAVQDKAYLLSDTYPGRAGFSWVYRWEPDPAKRKAMMVSEPGNPWLYNEYKRLTPGGPSK